MTALTIFRAAGSEADAQQLLAAVKQNAGAVPAAAEQYTNVPVTSAVPAGGSAAGATVESRGGYATGEPEAATPQGRKFAEDFKHLKAERDKQQQDIRARIAQKNISAPSPWNNNRPGAPNFGQRDSGQTMRVAGQADFPPAAGGFRGSSADPAQINGRYPASDAAFPGAAPSQANRPRLADPIDFAPAGNAAVSAGNLPILTPRAQPISGTQAIYQQPAAQGQGARDNRHYRSSRPRVNRPRPAERFSPPRIHCPPTIPIAEIRTAGMFFLRPGVLPNGPATCGRTLEPQPPSWDSVPAQVAWDSPRRNGPALPAGRSAGLLTDRVHPLGRSQWPARTRTIRNRSASNLQLADNLRVWDRRPRCRIAPVRACRHGPAVRCREPRSRQRLCRPPRESCMVQPATLGRRTSIPAGRHCRRFASSSVGQPLSRKRKPCAGREPKRRRAFSREAQPTQLRVDVARECTRLRLAAKRFETRYMLLAVDGETPPPC